jgi:hypothetical protein
MDVFVNLWGRSGCLWFWDGVECSFIHFGYQRTESAAKSPARNDATEMNCDVVVVVAIYPHFVNY